MLASALPDGAELWSYDLHVALRADLSGPQLDSELRAALERYGLTDRVHLVVGDSRTAEPPPRPCALVFVDGDHTYEGARADYERWSELVAPGGNLLFHDAVDAGGYGNHYPGIARLVGEIERDDAGARAAAGRGLDRALHAPPDAARRGRPLLERPRRHAGRARVAAWDRHGRGRQRLGRRLGGRDRGALPGRRADPRRVNLGFAGGNNVGIRRALDRGADWVLLVNNDATVEPGIVDALAAAAASRPDAGVLACKVLFADSDRLWYAGAGFDPVSAAAAATRLRQAGRARRRRRTPCGRRGRAMAVSRAAIDRRACSTRSSSSTPRIWSGACGSASAGFARRLRAPDARVRHRVTAATGGAGSPTAELLRGAEHARRRRAPTGRCRAA